MKRTLIGLTACAAILASCGDDADEQAADKAAGGAETTQRTSAGVAEPSTAGRRHGPRVELRASQLGRVLFDRGDRALYLFTRDARNRSCCYGECAAAWPPFLAISVSGRVPAVCRISCRIAGRKGPPSPRR